MTKYFKELLSETGTASIMRLAFILLIITGILISFIQIFFDFLNAWYNLKIKNDYFSLISLSFSTAALLKVGQKVIEKRQENQDPSQVQ